ncbi:MAG: hypothetical protein KatS3mg129_2216 [Leptospiraceae bacterium]|nr:MAG: hypothetical protein KatS3mg129_2216 [Leptospiraceae bacterium]
MEEIFAKKNDNNDNAVLALLLTGSGIDRTAIVKRYADLSYKIYNETYEKTLELQTAVNEYVSDPSSQTKLENARQKWIEARQKYLLTETLRFAEGPIDNPDILNELVDGNPTELEGLINAWPLDEQFNECFLIGSSEIGGSGCTTSHPLDEDSLINFNAENDKEENVATGWHPIEYLLWGKDDADATKEAGRGLSQTLSYFQNSTYGSRRRTYLQNATNILVRHMKMLRDVWNPSDANSYYHKFVNDPEALKKMITGFASFAKNELAAERFNGVDTRDQEDEHSCFSDTTNKDFYYDVLGIKIFFTGDYNGEEGPGLDSISGSYKDSIIKHLDKALEVMDPKNAPVYDVVIVDGANGRTQDHEDQFETIKFEVRPGLNNVGFDFVEIGESLGFKITPQIP